VRLLFDQNLSHRLCDLLAEAFPGCQQVRLAGLEREEDRAIWNFARANGFAVVSQDGEAAELATLLGPPPKVVWLTGGNRPTANIAATLSASADLLAAFESSEAACVELY